MSNTTAEMPQWRIQATSLLVPVLAIFTALVIGAIIIVATGADVLAAYGGLFMGAIGTPRAIAYTLVDATPYIFGGLAVLVGFRAGLFNIGVEGQIAVGSMCAAIVGAFVDLPPGLHMVAAFVAGALVVRPGAQSPAGCVRALGHTRSLPPSCLIT
jgi:simple sugar transport system permease protein